MLENCNDVRNNHFFETEWDTTLKDFLRTMNVLKNALA